MPHNQDGKRSGEQSPPALGREHAEQRTGDQREARRSGREGQGVDGRLEGPRQERGGQLRLGAERGGEGRPREARELLPAAVARKEPAGRQPEMPGRGRPCEADCP